MKIRLDQLIGTKQVARELPTLVRRLERGEGPFVVCRRNKPVALLSRFQEADHADTEEGSDRG